MAISQKFYKGTGDDLDLRSLNGTEGVASVSNMNPEWEAAEIMANARNKRVDEIKEKLDIKIRDYKEHMKTLTVLKKTKQSLLEEYLSLVKEKKNVLVDEYRKVITQLKLSELITAVDVDEEKRLIFTTRPIVVKKAKWKHARLAGVYQIRVDFSKSSYGSGIEILNITQRESDHDHPHINNTTPCWGNVSGDIEKDFKDKNAYELVVDTVDYLQSGADNDGYLQFDGDEEALKKEFAADEKDGSEDDYHAWEQFLTKAQKMPPGFCFAMYEQQKKEKKIPRVHETSEGSIAFTSINDLVIQSSVATEGAVTMAYNSGTTAWQNMTNATFPASPYANGRPVSYYQSEIARQLQELGLTNKASWHFMDYIKPSETLWIDRLELISRGEVYWLMVYGGPPPEPLNLMAMDSSSIFPNMTVSRSEIQRIFINTNDIQPEIATELSNHGVRAVRIGLQVNEMAHQEARDQQRREEIARQGAIQLQNQINQLTTPVQITSEEQLGSRGRPLGGNTLDELMVEAPKEMPDDFKQEYSSKSPEEAMRHYGLVAASDPRPVKKRKTLKFNEI